MPRPNFFNENINRAFPFQRGTVGVNTPPSGPVTMQQLPDDFIADCGFIMGAESGFVEGVHSVFLHKISRASASLLVFEFGCDAPLLLQVPLIFQRNVTDPLYTSEFAESDIPQEYIDSRSASLSLSLSAESEVIGEPYWSGYLVTGRLDQIATRLAVGQSIVQASAADGLVEPALIQNLDQNQLTMLQIANADRTRAIRPSDCPPNEWGFLTGGIFVQEWFVLGNVKFRAGYNMSLGQNSNSNTIQFAAVVNAGQGMPCEQVKLFSGETPPLGATNNLLAGDYYCNEVLRTVNGLAGPNLVLYAGVGVAIVPDNVNNRVVIDINLTDLSLCAYSEISISV